MSELFEPHGSHDTAQVRPNAEMMIASSRRRGLTQVAINLIRTASPEQLQALSDALKDIRAMRTVEVVESVATVSVLTDNDDGTEPGVHFEGGF